MCIPMLPFNYSYAKIDSLLEFPEGFHMQVPPPVSTDLITASAIAKQYSASRQKRFRETKKRTFSEAESEWDAVTVLEEKGQSEQLELLLAELSISEETKSAAIPDASPLRNPLHGDQLEL